MRLKLSLEIAVLWTFTPKSLLDDLLPARSSSKSLTQKLSFQDSGKTFLLILQI